MRLTLSPRTQFERSLLGFYCYTWAVEVFSCVSIAVFLPVVLEQLARQHGFRSGDPTLPCTNVTEAADASPSCSVFLLGVWVDSTSFSLYIKSASVAVQAITVISMSSLANHAFWRKRLLVAFAYIGACSAIFFIILPTSLLLSLYLAAMIAIASTVAFGTSFVCLNAFLPTLVRASPDFVAVSAGRIDGCDDESLDEEGTRLLCNQAVGIEATPVSGDDCPALSSDEGAPKQAAELSAIVNKLTSEISSTAVALGYTSGVSILILTLIPVTIMQGSLLSLRLAIFVSGLWWAVFTVPAAIWLPGGDVIHDERSFEMVRDKVREGWTKLGEMVKGSEIKRLPSTYWYLLAWALLADAFNTTTSIAILFGKVTLNMSASHVILIGILSQATAVLSAYFTPALQRRYGLSSMTMMLGSVVGVIVMCGYGMLGLMPGVQIGGLRTEGEMYACAVWFGIMFGPFMSMSRTVFSEIIPRGHEARFFSLFSICDKGASWIGPGAIAIISDLTGEIRYGFVFLAVLLAIPIPILIWKVDIAKGRRDAEVYSETEARGEEVLREARREGRRTIVQEGDDLDL